MEKGKKNLLTITMVFVLLFASAQTSDFKSCFPSCPLPCLFNDHKVVCALECFGKCLLFASSQSELGYCNHGCAVDQCARLITEDFKFKDIEKVVNCVGKCDHEIDQCNFLDQSTTSSSGAPSP